MYMYLYANMNVWNRVHIPNCCVSSYQLLSRSLDYVDNEEWLMELGNALGDKEKVIGRYSNFPDEKVGNKKIYYEKGILSLICNQAATPNWQYTQRV